MYKRVLQLPTITVSNHLSFVSVSHQHGARQHHFPHSNLLRNTVIIKEYAGGPQPHQCPLRKKTWHKYTSQNIEHFVFDTKLVEFYGVLRVVSCQGIGWYRSGIKGSFLYWRFNSPWFHLWRFDETVLFLRRKNTFLEDVFLNEK